MARDGTAPRCAVVQSRDAPSPIQNKKEPLTLIHFSVSKKKLPIFHRAHLGNNKTFVFHSFFLVNKLWLLCIFTSKIPTF